jgi:hypothetical protein
MAILNSNSVQEPSARTVSQIGLWSKGDRFTGALLGLYAASIQFPSIIAAARQPENSCASPAVDSSIATGIR